MDQYWCYLRGVHSRQMKEDGTKMNGSTSVQVTKPQSLAANCVDIGYRSIGWDRWCWCTGMDELSSEVTVKKWFSFFWKVIYSKWKEFASSGSVFFPFRVGTKGNNLLQQSKFFLFRVDYHFSEGAWYVRGMLRSGFFWFQKHRV